MGYYSEVTLALTKTGVKALRRRLKNSSIPEKARKEVSDMFKYASKHSRNKETGAEIWYWDLIKWYTCDPENFPEVDFIEEFLIKLKEKDYRFMRIGEDYDDVEVSGLFFDDPFGLKLHRQIGMTC